MLPQEIFTVRFPSHGSCGSQSQTPDLLPSVHNFSEPRNQSSPGSYQAGGVNGCAGGVVTGQDAGGTRACRGEFCWPIAGPGCAGSLWHELRAIAVKATNKIDRTSRKTVIARSSLLKLTFVFIQ